MCLRIAQTKANAGPVSGFGGKLAQGWALLKRRALSCLIGPGNWFAIVVHSWQLSAQNGLAACRALLVVASAVDQY